MVAGGHGEPVGELGGVHAPQQRRVEVPGVAEQQVVAGPVRRRRPATPACGWPGRAGPAQPGRPARRPVQGGRQGSCPGAGDAAAQPGGAQHVAVEVVAGEQLVAAEPGQDHGDVLADEPVQQVQLQRVDLGLLGVPDGVRQVREGRLVQHHLLVLGAEGARHEPGVVGLVGGLVEAEAERLDGPARGAPEHGHDGTRVDAPGQRDADGHVRDELPLDRGLVVEPDSLEPFGRGAGRVRRPVDRRVRLQPGAPLGELQHVPGRQALDAGEERPVPGDVADVHRQVQAGLVELGRDEPAREHGLGLGPEGQLAAGDRVHQRLHPERVPDQEQRAAGPVEQGEREDPVEPGRASRSPRPRTGGAGSRCRSGWSAGARGPAPARAARGSCRSRRCTRRPRSRPRWPSAGRRPARPGSRACGYRGGPNRRVEALAVGAPVGDRVGHGPQQLLVPEARRTRYPAHGRSPIVIVAAPRRRSRSSQPSRR